MQTADSHTKSVAFHTLGCKLNFSETSTLGRMLEADGFLKKEFEEEADVYVINTCSVTDNADKECRQLVRRIQRRSPESLVVITGCYAQLKPKEIAAIPGVDLVLGAAEKFNLAKHLGELTKGDSTRISSCDISEVNAFVPSYSQGDRTRSFLKVQDGCNYLCSFCTIPQARGRSRSNTIEHVLQQVNDLAAQGVKEIVLTGVNLGDFTSPNGENFFQLVKRLDEEATGIGRFRISSIEPNLLSDDIIRFVATSRAFMPHFHIPLQSGSNSVLALMRRRYKRELYASRVELIKQLMPHACIGADVIVGHPGETEDAFAESFEFIQSLPVDYLHVFTYSERSNTHALSIEPVVAVPVRHARNKRLRTLSYEKQHRFNQQHVGQQRPVLFEAFNKDGMMEGYTDNYIRIQTTYHPQFANSIQPWRITA